jgi:hypothetical protein
MAGVEWAGSAADMTTVELTLEGGADVAVTGIDGNRRDEVKRQTRRGVRRVEAAVVARRQTMARSMVKKTMGGRENRLG